MSEKKRKCFLSFLGAIPYSQTQYYWNPDRSDLGKPMDYVQEAIIRKCLVSWKPNDRVYIFTTPEAYEFNYLHKIQRFDKVTKLPVVQKDKGLYHVLKGLMREGIIGHFEPITIPNGYTEQEILEVFQIVFEKLEPKAEVYFDITFGFRSLPMLGIVLLNYARNVINTKVKAIYYGNYEAGRAAKQVQIKAARNRFLPEKVVQQLEKSPIQTPILNLLSLSILQEWTAAAQSFIDQGKAAQLSGLVRESHPNLAKQLLQFEEAITSCRGLLLAKQLDVNDLKSVVADSKNGMIKEQLKPLISRIEEKITPFETKNTLNNGYAAVEWCIQHNMIQQGITFLQETIVSFFVEQFFGVEYLTDHFFRELTSSAIKQFTVSKNHNFNRKRFTLSENAEKEWIKSTYLSICDFAKAYSPLTALFTELSNLRNDINHCGFDTSYRSPESIQEALKDAFTRIKAINLQQIHVN